MDAAEEPFTNLSRAAAASMLTRLQELHHGSERTVEETLMLNMPELQAISDSAKQNALRLQLAAARAGREAGGIGAERRFDQALDEIDSINQAWDDDVRASFHRHVREWVDSGGPVLGPGGWVQVRVTQYQRGSIWWTDHERTALWCSTIAGDIFSSITHDVRSRSGDVIELVRLSEPSIGQAIESSVEAMLTDFQDQQRYDAGRYGVHPVQAQEAAGRIAALRGPWASSCRVQLAELLHQWDAQGRPATAPQ